MEPKLVIRTETPPERCDICHQSDLFDPLSGQCARCKNLPDEIVKRTAAPSVAAPRLSIVVPRENPRSEYAQSSPPNPEKNKNFAVLFAALSGNIFFNIFNRYFSDMPIPTSKWIWGAVFAALAISYWCEGRDRTFRPNDADRAKRYTDSRWGIFWLGSFSIDLVNIFEKGVNFYTIVWVIISSAFALKHFNRVYQSKISNDPSVEDQTPSRSNDKIKLIESLLFTIAAIIGSNGLITDYNFGILPVLGVIGLLFLMVSSWFEWNKAKNSKDGSKTVRQAAENENNLMRAI